MPRKPAAAAPPASRAGAVRLQPSGATRNPVARALAERRTSGAAGRHADDQSAERRATRAALRRWVAGDD